MMNKRYLEELRHDLRQKRKDIARIESMLDYVDELEWQVASQKARIEILIEAKTEQSNEEEAYGSSNPDEQ